VWLVREFVVLLVAYAYFGFNSIRCFIMSVNTSYYANLFFLKCEVLVFCLQYVICFHCRLIYYYVAKDCGRSAYIAQLNIIFDTRWEWSAWPHGCFNTDWIVGRIGLSAGLALSEYKHSSRQWTAPQTAEMKGLKRKCSHLGFGFENAVAMND
jgi:hypothetical protein